MKKIIAILPMFLLSWSGKAMSSFHKFKDTYLPPDSLHIDTSKIAGSFYSLVPSLDSIINFGKSFLGTPYHYGGTNTETGFDCSGFIQYIFGHFGVELPRDSRSQSKLGEKNTSFAKIQKGDLLFFKRPKSKYKIVGHVGLVIEVTDDKIYFLHSSWRGVNIEELTTSDYYRHRFLFARHISGLFNSGIAAEYHPVPGEQ
jgi:hypothetical protein